MAALETIAHDVDTDLLGEDPIQGCSRGYFQWQHCEE